MYWSEPALRGVKALPIIIPSAIHRPWWPTPPPPSSRSTLAPIARRRSLKKWARRNDVARLLTASPVILSRWEEVEGRLAQLRLLRERRGVDFIFISLFFLNGLICTQGWAMRLLSVMHIGWIYYAWIMDYLAFCGAYYNTYLIKMQNLRVWKRFPFMWNWNDNPYWVIIDSYGVFWWSCAVIHLWSYYDLTWRFSGLL